MKHNIVYRVVNKVNGKIYIGVHSTDNLNDGYLGSGIGIKRAIKKYGKNNFQRDVLFDFDNQDDMYQMERTLVDEALVSQIDTYNANIGGYGGSVKGRKVSEQARENIRKGLLGRKFSEKHKENLSKALKGKPGTMIGEKSPEHMAKIAKALTGKKLTIKHKENISKGKKNPSEETRKKISESVKKRPNLLEHMAKMRANSTGMLGKAHSQETKEKISKAKKGKPSPNKGKVFSKESRRKMSESAKRAWKQRRLING